MSGRYHLTQQKDGKPLRQAVYQEISGKPATGGLAKTGHPGCGRKPGRSARTTGQPAGETFRQACQAI